MATGETFVIVGASLAGAKAAEALRAREFGGRVVLIGAERHRPYERPPLSKGYLTGAFDREKVFVHPDGWYEQHDVELRPSSLAVAIDRPTRRVRLDGGEEIEYSKLLLTTGAHPRRLPVPGADAEGVLYLRTLDDSEHLRGTFAMISRLVVVGAGWIGLEAAAAARGAGVDVTVVEAAAQPLLAALGPEMGAFFADLHRRNAVDLRLSQSIAEITTQGRRATGVRLTDGTVLPADAVLVGIGAAPDTQLAEQARLPVDNGILVDAALRTEDPDIFAAGDVANAHHPLYGQRIRVEHWANALNQPPIAADGMLGLTAQYRRLPYFFTDQYDLGMEYTGYLPRDGYDQLITRGDPAGGEFIAFWLAGGRVVAGMNVNVWDVTEPIEELITSRRLVDAARLADPNVAVGE